MAKVPHPELILQEEAEADQELLNLAAYCCPSCEKSAKGGCDWDEYQMKRGGGVTRK